jgi:hypothetical protein
MTKEQLLDSIKHLTWSRHYSIGLWPGMLRCAKGDCPLIAAYQIYRFHNPWLPNLSSNNYHWSIVAKYLGIDIEVARELVRQADGLGLKDSYKSLDIALGATVS